MDRREELYIKELKPGVYLLDERHEVAGYLIVGRKKALMIDTMNGYTDLRRAVRKITDKPVMVVNTHGHTNDFDDISLLRCMRQGCMEICAGKTQKDVPCKESFEVGMQHEFALEPGKYYQREDSVICYSPQRVNHK